MRLTIESIKIRDVQDTGNMLDAQDPCVTITLGKQSKETERNVDAGSNCDFAEKFVFEINEESLGQELIVEVHNKSVVGTKKHVGIAKRVLREAISKKNVDEIVSFNLTFVKGKKETPKGTLSFKARIIDDIIETKLPDQNAIPESTKSAPLAAVAAPISTPDVTTITSAQQDVATAKNIDPVVHEKKTSAMNTKNDTPILDKPVDHTPSAPVEPSSGKKRVMKRGAPSASDSKPKEEEELPAFHESDENPTEPTLGKKKVIKRGESTAPPTKPNPLDRSLVSDPRGPKDTEQNSQAAPTASAGNMTLIIERISIQDMQDTGRFMDGQDPAATIIVGSQRQETERQKDTGTSCNFPERFSFSIPSGDLDQEIIVEVNNKKSDGSIKSLIGSGRILLRDAIPRQNTDTEVKIELFYKKGKKDVHQGTLTLFGKLVDEKVDDQKQSAKDGKKAVDSPATVVEPPVSEKIRKGKKDVLDDDKDSTSQADDAKVSGKTLSNATVASTQQESEGKSFPIKKITSIGAGPMQLLITDIQIRDVEDTGGMFDGQDPAVVLTLGNQVKQTKRLMDHGVNADFPEEFSFEVTEADFDTELVIEVMNVPKSGKGGKHVGVARKLLREIFPTPNSDAKPVFELVHKQGKRETKKGTLSFNGRLQSGNVRALQPSESVAKEPAENKSNEKQKKSKKSTDDALERKVSEESELAPSSSDAKDPQTTLKRASEKITYLKIRRVHVKGLPNVEALFGENDPWVDLAFGEKWSGKTTVVNEGGGDVTWDIAEEDKGMTFDVTLPELRAVKMSISVTDHNDMLAHKLIGSGEGYVKSVLDVPIGTDCVVNFKLKNTKGKPAGEADITFQLHEREVPVAAATYSGQGKSAACVEEGKTDEPFVDGTLRIHRIKCLELKDVETVGKNDPYVILSLAAWRDQTEAIEDAGDSGLWDNLDFAIPVTSDIIDFESLRITVMERNSLSSNKTIGSGITQLTRLHLSLQSTPSSEVDLVVNLVDEKKKFAGKVIVYATLDRYVEKSTMDIEVSDKLTKGTLAVTRIRAKELRNVEIVGKSDPYVVLSFAEHPFMTTTPQMEAGSTASWTNLDLKVVNVTKKELMDHHINVEVWDKNDITSDKIIGTGKVSARAAGADLGNTVECRVDLVDSKGTFSGRVVLDVVVTEGVIATDDAVDVSKLSVSESFTSGKVQVKRICVFDATNTEWIGKQDLYVSLSCDEWSQQTDTLDNAGASATWNDLDWSFPVNKESLPSKSLKVSVYDENVSRGDVLIGEKDGISIMRAAADVGKDVTLNVILPNDKKGKPTGRVTILLCVKEDDVPEDEIVVDNSFAQGCLHISKIVMHGVKRQKKNYAKVIFGQISMDTEMKPGPVYDYLNMKLPLTLEKLKSDSITVQACSKGMLGGEDVVGTGTVRIVRAGASVGEEVELEMKLVDSKGKDIGKAVVYATVKNEEADAAEKAPPPEKPINLPDGFAQGILYINQVKAFGLTNKEYVGKSDPFVTFEFDSEKGAQSLSTKPFMNAGGDVIWDDVDIKLRMTADDILANKSIQLSVWDANTMRNNVCIGTATRSLRRFASRLSNEIEMSADIIDPKTNKVSGRLVFFGELREAEADVELSLPEGFKSGVLRIVRIVTFSLANRELMGKQDPYVKVKAGDYYDEKTFTQEEAGGDVTWNYLDMAVPVTADFLKNEKLRFEAWEDNFGPDLLIGRGECGLRNVVTIGEEVELNISLLDDKKKPSGRLSVFVRLEPPPPKEIEISKEFTNGTFYVTRITAFGLSHTEWFGKSDPYVSLTIGTWEGHTNSLENKGDNVMWDYLDLRCPVSAEVLRREKVSVTVFDKNALRKDAIIGTGEVRIAKAGVTLDKEVELCVDLINAKGKPEGRVVLYAKAKEGVEPDDSTLVVDDRFQFGTLSIVRIRSFELKNTETFGLQDPYVVLKIGEWSDKTHTIDEGGGDVLWEFLDLRCDVTADMLTQLNLDVDVFDENKMSKDTFIGRASCKLVKPGAYVGEEVELAVTLNDDAGNYAGRLVIYAVLSEEVPELAAVVPDSFGRGELKIKRVSGFDLKNTEVMGKQDPYVELIQEDCEFHEKTTVQQDIGANPVWNFLDFSTIVKSSVAKVGRIQIKVWDKNTSGDTLIGIGDVGIRKAAANLGGDVELRTKIFDENEKEAGRIVLVANLRELPPEAADKDIKLPKSFTSGIVHINRITATGLKNKEIFGKQDPYVKLDLVSWSGRTETRPNAGGNASWPQISHLKIEVDREILLDHKLRISVCDENTIRDHKTLGTGKVSLRPLASRMNSEVELTVHLSENGAACGTIVLGATLREARAEEIVNTMAESSVKITEGLLTVKSVTAKDIIGGDSGMFDKQDLYVVLELDTWKWTSPYQNNSGSTASWNDLEGVVTPVNSDILKLKRLKASVWDKNISANKLIGCGDVSLRLPGSTPDRNVLLSIPITNKHRENCGVVEVLVQVNESVLARPGDPNAVQDANAGLTGGDSGIFEIRKIRMAGLKNTEWFGKQDPYVEISLGAFWKHKTDVKSNAGTNALWETEISQEITAAHLQRSNFDFVVKEKNSSRADEYLGRGSVSGMPLLQKPNEWISLTGDLKPTGKFFIDAKYITQSAAVASGKSSKSAKQMEDALKKQLQDELDKERRKMAEMMAEQNRMLQDTLKNLQGQAGGGPSDQPWHGMSVTELKKVVLPSNVYDWRAAHVQAWLAFKMDLPQHVQQFQNASIDGFLLLKHIDETVLRDRLQVGDELDVAKIMGGIQRLKTRQAGLDRTAAIKEAEEEAAVVEAVEKAEKKKKKKPDPVTFFGDVKEQNDLERVRLERMMRQKRAEEAKAKKKLATRSDVWKFEYTGGVKPVSNDEELYGDIRTKHAGNTAAYERAMAGLFRDNAITTDMTVPSYTGGMRQVPRDSVVDEVVAITKAAMFELSNRLLEIEKRRAANEKDADSDIDVDEFGEDVKDVALDDVPEQKGVPDVDSDEEELQEELGPPPEYDDPVARQNPKSVASIPPISFDTTQLKTVEIEENSKRFDRSLLVFNALVNRQNNDASFLGKNDKLTRMKFHGGLEAVLKLKMSWPQFDALWTKLDFKRSGELDHEEFGQFFGDFSEYDYEKSKRNRSIDTLADIMYDLCNAVRREGFNVVEIFSSFDRNGSGEVSVSEFCSMVRAVLGHHVDKKKIFRAFALMDVDANRCISCQEVLTLVYNVWKSQMKELAAKLSDLDDEIDGPLIKKIMDERNQIKDAVKRNFPREWRDRLERTKDQYSKGAFAHLLSSMNVSTVTSRVANGDDFHDTFASSGKRSMSSTMPLPSSNSTIRSPTRPLPPKVKKISGKNELLRYKVNKSRTHVPTREGATLKIPHVTNFGQTDITSEGAALRKLQQTEPVGGKVFVMTSNL